MTIWLLALALTAVACATLYYAGAASTVNAGATTRDATTAHFRAQLGEIEGDVVAGRMGEPEATAAKAELAREVMRLGAETPAVAARGGRAMLLLPVLGIAVLALGTYGYLGHPELPAMPLAERTAVNAANQVDLGAAMKAVEARLAQNPNDLRGWQVIAPVYMQEGRYADAVTALRHVNDLAPPTADTLTDLGEALMMSAGGTVAGEPLTLFRRAATLDPKHVRSRFYIAAEETRAGNNDDAIRDWNALLALAQGDEPWAVTARNGLAAAQQAKAGGTGATAAPDTAQIDAMVDGLEARLMAQGGDVSEWTQLVRSRLVQGRAADAQSAYDAARKAYPDAAARAELDTLALQSGLVAK